MHHVPVVPSAYLSDPVRGLGRCRRQRYLADRVSLAGVAAQRQRIRCLDRRGSSLAAAAALHPDRRHRGGLPWQTACFADLRCTVGDHGGGGSGAGAHVRRTAASPSASLAVLAALGALFDPAGITARESMLPEAAARAGWTLDRTNGVYEAIFNVAYIVGPGLGGLLIATIGGINTMWVTAGAFGVSIARDRRAAAGRRRSATGCSPPRWAMVRDGRRPAVRVESAGAAHAGTDRPGNDRPVPADGKRAVPQVLHRPP